MLSVRFPFPDFYFCPVLCDRVNECPRLASVEALLGTARSVTRAGEQCAIFTREVAPTDMVPRRDVSMESHAQQGRAVGSANAPGDIAQTVATV